MKGHVKKRGDRYYAVIYEGRDPVTGKERRSWHPDTMQTYQHVLPGMQADAARSTERLAKPTPPTERDTGEGRGNRRRKSA